MLARWSKHRGDTFRIDTQSLILRGLREKILTPNVIPKIPRIYQSTRNSILTDLPPQKIIQLLCLLPKLDRNKLIFTTLPDELLEPGRTYIPQMRNTAFTYTADMVEIRKFIATFKAGD